MFEWDDANIEHIARHGLEPEDVEAALLDPKRIPAPSYDEARNGAGSSEPRMAVFVVYTEHGGNIRPITAREASKSEKRRYKR